MVEPIHKRRRVVIALGGNALGDTPKEQIERVRAAAPALLGVIDEDTEIIITHGNGPQVGMDFVQFGPKGHQITDGGLQVGNDKIGRASCRERV